MKDILNEIEAIIKNHGYEQSASFQKHLDDCLSDISNLISRCEAYYFFLKISNDHLSDENSDYLCDIVSDITGHTAKIYYKFSDDPSFFDDEQLLNYVRENTWNKKIEIDE